MPKIDLQTVPLAVYNAAINDDGLPLALRFSLEPIEVLVGEFLEVDLPTAEGGIGDYEYYVDGELPPGMASQLGEVDAPSISGRVNLAGVWDFTFGVSDGMNRTFNLPIEIRVIVDRNLTLEIVDDGTAPASGSEIALSASVSGSSIDQIDVSNLAFAWEFDAVSGVTGSPAIVPQGSTATLTLPDSGTLTVDVDVDVEGTLLSAERSYTVQAGVTGKTLSIAAITGNARIGGNEASADYTALLKSEGLVGIPAFAWTIAPTANVTLSGGTTATVSATFTRQATEQTYTLTATVTQDGLTATRDFTVVVAAQVATRLATPPAPTVATTATGFTITAPTSVAGMTHWAYRYRQAGMTTWVRAVAAIAVANVDVVATGGVDYQFEVARFASTDRNNPANSLWSPVTTDSYGLPALTALVEKYPGRNAWRAVAGGTETGTPLYVWYGILEGTQSDRSIVNQSGNQGWDVERILRCVVMRNDKAAYAHLPVSFVLRASTRVDQADIPVTGDRVVPRNSQPELTIGTPTGTEAAQVSFTSANFTGMTPTVPITSLNYQGTHRFNLNRTSSGGISDRRFVLGLSDGRFAVVKDIELAPYDDLSGVTGEVAGPSNIHLAQNQPGITSIVDVEMALSGVQSDAQLVMLVAGTNNIFGPEPGNVRLVGSHGAARVRSLAFPYYTSVSDTTPRKLGVYVFGGNSIKRIGEIDVVPANLACSFNRGLASQTITSGQRVDIRVTVNGGGGNTTQWTTSHGTVRAASATETAAELTAPTVTERTIVRVRCTVTSSVTGDTAWAETIGIVSP